MQYSDLEDAQLAQLIDNRWQEGATVWSKIETTTKKNTEYYEGRGDWWKRARIPASRPKPNTNRIFVNTEAVINSLIANPPRPNAIPEHGGEESREVARMIEKVLNIKYTENNTKEVFRQSLRDIYFSRLMVVKPFWNKKTNDIDVKRVDPNKVRFSSTAKNELNSDFAIEEITTTLQKLIEQFPEKKQAILQEANMSEEQMLITNPPAVYREAWIGDSLCVKFRTAILFKGRNPYWDWDGVKTTRDELLSLRQTQGKARSKAIRSMREAKAGDFNLEGYDANEYVQDIRKADEEGKYETELFNYFDIPRKPYIFATVLTNEDTPIGRTSFIEQAASIQELVDRLTYNLFLNAELVNGITKVDSSIATGVSKADAQIMRSDAGGVLWGKGVMEGVKREFGVGLPPFVFNVIELYMSEIDNIMAATSAFRGEREGQETKAGRLALVEQSFMRLNEMVQVVDYVSQELFGWWIQLMKVHYTETHYIKEVGQDGAVEIMELQQDDIESGMEIRVIPGKTLPEDKRFQFDRAQGDVQAGLLSPIDYFEQAGYANPKELAKNKFEYDSNPSGALGITQNAMPVEGTQETPEQEAGIPQAEMQQFPPV